LKDCFSGYGTVEAVAQWRRVSPLKTQARFNEPPQTISPPADEDVIWQTWVPLTESAKYLELQVWYPEHILTIREGDKGYRYQIELAPEGETDGRESRVVGSNKNSLTVESLGGRADALQLPVPL
jgi:hypothetical protein